MIGRRLKNYAIDRYEEDQITREVLDSIKVGDWISVNMWASPLRVYAVSKNFFVMARWTVKGWVYSVCEKTRRWHQYNGIIPGYFHCGDDFWLFGAPVWSRFNCKGYDFKNAEAAQAYINSFEDASLNDLGSGGELSHISDRRATPIKYIEIFRKTKRADIKR